MKNKGFTLVETVIVFAIFFVIGGAIFATLTMGRKSWQSGNVQVEMQQEARRALGYMSKELRQTGSNKIQGIADGGSGSSIIFEIPYDVDGDGDVIDAGGTIEWSDDPGPNRIGAITYLLSGGQILRNLSLGGESVLANKITGLTFSRPSAMIVEIDVTAEKYTFKGFTSVGDEKVTINLNTQVTLRN